MRRGFAPQIIGLNWEGGAPNIANSKFMTDQEPSIPASKIVSDMSLYASLHASANTDNCIRRIVKILFEMEQFKWKVIK